MRSCKTLRFPSLGNYQIGQKREGKYYSCIEQIGLFIVIDFVLFYKSEKQFQYRYLETNASRVETGSNFDMSIYFTL